MTYIQFTGATTCNHIITNTGTYNGTSTGINTSPDIVNSNHSIIDSIICAGIAFDSSFVANTIIGISTSASISIGKVTYL